MKKVLSVILGTAVALSMLSTGNVFASQDISVEIDGKVIDFDVKPQIEDGLTLVPLRKIFEEIGALIKWNGETKTVTARKNSKTVTFSIGSEEMTIDKGKTDDDGNPIVETVDIEVPAKIDSGRTLVPVRAISESFGLDVQWNDAERKVVIISDEEEDNSWEENTGTLNLGNLTFDGKGIEISEKEIKVTAGGDYTLTGTLKDGNITVSTNEKVKLRLKNASITSENGPCIFVEKADKAYITISKDTQNSLIAKNSEDGAIYSKENLEIKGNGALSVESLAGHGIKASDNLKIENGNIRINATTDGIHINDTLNISGGNLDIISVCDGIDSESIVNISGGKITIGTTAVPIEPAKETTDAAGFPGRGMWEENTEVEFEKSSKGINAEWMMVISGGEIDVNSASHAIHCEDEVQIDGGKFSLNSKYEKGISAHGNLTINGADTVVNVTKSTEGLESKNVMTINDGAIKIVSTNDAINATGGISGTMMMPGFGGNNGGNRVPPEWGERPSQVPENDENDGTATQQRPRPQRGQSAMQWPPFELPEGEEFKPPFEIPEGEEFRPPFEMPEGGFMGGRSDLKTCLVINGGYIDVCGGDDCIDSNGNIVVNGGTIKAAYPSGSFTGNFGVVDSDGQIKISEDATLVFAAGSGNGRGLGLVQNTVIVYTENSHGESDKISVSDEGGNVLLEYVPGGSFKTVLIASEKIETGKKYKITIGNETFETEISAQSTTIGTQTNSNRWFRG